MLNMLDDTSNFLHHSNQLLNKEMPKEGTDGGGRRRTRCSRASLESPRRSSHSLMVPCSGGDGHRQAQGVESVAANDNWPADAAQASSAPRLGKETPNHVINRFNQFSPATFGTFARLQAILILCLTLCVRSVQGQAAFV